MRRPGLTSASNARLDSLPPLDQRPTRVRYTVMAFVCVLSFLTYFDRVCIMRAQRLIEFDLHITHAQMGIIFGAFWLAYALFEMPGGWMGDRFGAEARSLASCSHGRCSPRFRDRPPDFSRCLPTVFCLASAKPERIRISRACSNAGCRQRHRDEPAAYCGSSPDGAGRCRRCCLENFCERSIPPDFDPLRKARRYCIRWPTCNPGGLGSLPADWSA